MKFLLDKDLEKVAAIVSQGCPAIDTKNVAFLSRGWDNLAFKIGNYHVARFPRDKVAYEALCREEVFCRFIKGKVSLQTPDLKVYCADDYPFSLHRFIPGESLTKELYLKLSEDQKDCVAKHLVEFFRFFHSINTKEAKNLGAKKIKDHTDIKFIKENIEKREFGGVATFVKSIICEYEKIIVKDCDIVFGYYDAHGKNMSFDANKGALFGIFDLADSGMGDIHQEFHPLNEISADLSKRTIFKYQKLTGRSIDWNRVRLYSTIFQISQFAKSNDQQNLVNSIKELRSELFPE